MLSPYTPPRLSNAQTIRAFFFATATAVRFHPRRSSTPRLHWLRLAVFVRAQRSVETRRALEQAAIALFLEQGYDRTTIDDIATAAGVSARTFFRHFDAKEDVLIGDQGEMRRRLARCFADRPDDEPLLTCVREALIAFAGEYEDERDDHLRRARVSWSVPSVWRLISVRPSGPNARSLTGEAGPLRTAMRRPSARRRT